MKVKYVYLGAEGDLIIVDTTLVYRSKTWDYGGGGLFFGALGYVHFLNRTLLVLL